MSTVTPSIPARYGVILFFALMLLGAFGWLAYNTYYVIIQLTLDQPYFIFDKGSFYMLGISIVLCSLLYAFIYETLKNTPLPDKASKNVSRIAYAGIVTIFLIPQIVHYAVDEFVTNRGYQVCEKASYRWLLYRNIVFTRSKEACEYLASGNR